MTMAKRSYDLHVLKPSDCLEAWDAFVDSSPQGSVFCRSWWLRAVCGDSFEILTLNRAGEMVAGLPLYFSRRWIFKTVSMPLLTQALGPLLAPSSKTTYEGRLSEQMSILSELVDAIPRCDLFHMRCHHNLTNWLPFFWAGYRQTTQYTYLIPDLTDLDKVFSEFSHSKRKNINKAEGLVEVHEDLPAEEFHANHVMTLEKQGERITYDLDVFKRIYDAAHRNRAAKTWYALDAKNNIHAAILVVFDRHSAYYLISTIDPGFRSSGAATLLVRDAISYVSKCTKRFDFEGSMIAGVEQSFRKFGAILTPYFSLHKDNRRLPMQLLGGAYTAYETILRKFGFRR